MLAGVSQSDLQKMIRTGKIFALPKITGESFLSPSFDPADALTFTAADIEKIKTIAGKSSRSEKNLKSYPPVDNTDYSPADLAAAWNYSVDTIGIVQQRKGRN